MKMGSMNKEPFLNLVSISPEYVLVYIIHAASSSEEYRILI